MSTYRTRKQMEQRRRRAIALLDQAYTQAEAARMLDVTPGAVSQWKKRRDEHGLTALKAKPHPGPTPKLSDGHCRKLLRLLKQGPVRHGYQTERWTLPRVVDLIQRHFGVTYDQSGVWHVLNRLGWSCQKPEKRARERNEAAIKRWRTRQWPRIKKSAAKRETPRLCR